MFNREIYKIWAPTNKRWVDWARPVAFIGIDPLKDIHDFIDYEIHPCGPGAESVYVADEEVLSAVCTFNDEETGENTDGGKIDKRCEIRYSVIWFD